MIDTKLNAGVARTCQIKAIKNMASKYTDMDEFARDATWLHIVSSVSEGRRLFHNIKNIQVKV